MQEKARKFKQHREAHYNEFKALQEWRDKRSGDMMDDDSDSEGSEGDTTEVKCTDARVCVCFVLFILSRCRAPDTSC